MLMFWVREARGAGKEGVDRAAILRCLFWTLHLYAMINLMKKYFLDANKTFPLVTISE